jgi:hypothetical protein
VSTGNNSVPSAWWGLCVHKNSTLGRASWLPTCLYYLGVMPAADHLFFPLLNRSIAAIQATGLSPPPFQPSDSPGVLLCAALPAVSLRSAPHPTPKLPPTHPTTRLPRYSWLTPSPKQPCWCGQHPVCCVRGWLPSTSRRQPAPSSAAQLPGPSELAQGGPQHTQHTRNTQHTQQLCSTHTHRHARAARGLAGALTWCCCC